MKSGTTEHPKFRMLRAVLQLPDWGVVGILESLWNITAKWKDHGGIGEWSNAEIACAIGWVGDPEQLIEALTRTGWLDEHPTHRLMVHDWQDHQPRYVTERIRLQQKRGKRQVLHNVGNGCQENAHTQPNPTKPNHIPPNPQGGSNAEALRRAADVDGIAPLPKDNTGFTRFWAAWPAHPRKAAKAQCARHWKRQGCDDITEQVIAAVERCKVSRDWVKNSGEFIPAPATWLNQRRWEAPATLAPQGAEAGYSDVHTPEEIAAIFGEDVDAAQ